MMKRINSVDSRAIIVPGTGEEGEGENLSDKIKNRECENWEESLYEIYVRCYIGCRHQCCKKFYEDLFGLELYQDYGINISFTCGLSLQQCFDWLVNMPEDQVLKESNNIEICFEESDFDGFLNKLKNYPGIEYLGDVIEHGWGQRVIRFYDPDGHIVEVGEDMKMVIHRFLASGMTMEKISVKMDASVENLSKLLGN